MKIKTFTLRIEEALLDKLREIAKYNDRTINEELNNTIKRKVIEFEKQNGIINYGKNQNIINGNNNTINN